MPSKRPLSQQQQSYTQVFPSHSLQLLHSLIQFLRILKRPPNLPRHIPKRLLKPLIRILIRILHLRDVRHLPNEHRLDPPPILPTNIAIRFRITLRAVPHTKHLPSRQPAMYFLYAAPLIRFSPLREGGEEAA